MTHASDAYKKSSANYKCATDLDKWLDELITEATKSPAKFQIRIAIPSKFRPIDVIAALNAMSYAVQISDGNFITISWWKAGV